MSKGSPYAQETRQQISKLAINQSTAKTLWSFSKEKRFQKAKSNCPYVSYLSNVSSISQRKNGFGSQQRRVFSQASEVPSSWNYTPQKEKSGQVPVFALSRENCMSSTYYNRHPEQVPGPGRYVSASQSKTKGYSMRPKTANNRNYFIDDKEMKQMPSPFEYQHIDSTSKETVSKFRSVTLGNSSMQSKNQRFKQFNQKTPSPFVYHPKKYAITKFCKGGKMGRCNRLSFIDNAASTAYTPGPGNYETPTEFAHYKPRNSVA